MRCHQGSGWRIYGEVLDGSKGGVSKADFQRILRVLAQHDVRYVLVGGLAGLAHDSTLSTADADLLPRPDLRIDATNRARGHVYRSVLDGE